MGVAHLQGKRTGRPRGAKTRPAWLRALDWAEKHLGDPDAVPPSPLAAQYLKLGREHPERFLACLAARDGKSSHPPQLPVVHRDPRPGAPTTVVDAPAYPHTGKVKTMVIPCWDLYQMLAGERPRRAMGNMPPDGQIVGAELTGNQLRLTIRADSLPAVGAGQPVPEEWARFVVLEVTVGGRFV